MTLHTQSYLCGTCADRAPGEVVHQMSQEPDDPPFVCDRCTTETATVHVSVVTR